MKTPSPALMTDSMEFFPPLNKLKKKTRGLPNLSDCHGCIRRINSTNPENRLQILASEWRIVLLCKNCYNFVETSQNCSYCLARVSCSSMESFVTCNRCHRRIHKECLSMFCFGLGDCCVDFSSVDDFKVCFDCWMPKLLETDYNARVLRSRSKKKKVMKNGDEKVGGEPMNSLGSSGVSGLQEKEKGKDAAYVANVAQAIAGKKVALAIEAKERALNKAMVAKRAMVLASSSVGLVSVDKEGDRRVSEVDDDAQLAFRLHRAMNSSPRILRYSCSLNTHCVDVPEVNGDMNGLDLRTEVGTSRVTKLRKNGGDLRNGLSEARQDCEQKCARIQDGKRNEGSAGNLITYYRKGRASSEVKEEPDFSRRMDNGGLSLGNLGVKNVKDSALRTYRRRLSKLKWFKRELGHCSKTYCRRQSSIPHCKNKMIYGIKLETGTLTPAFALNGCEESRTFTAAS